MKPTAPVTTWEIHVTTEARAALAGRGITDVPDVITLQLREPTMRELRPLDQAMQAAQDDPFAGGVYVIQARATQPVSAAVAREVLDDFTPVELAELLWAFKHGERDTEGKVAGAVKQTLSGMSERLLTAFGSAVSPSPSASTDSTPPAPTN